MTQDYVNKYDIKPIPTKYNGIQFRSRLEARWALFFDLIGLEYQYEPEGYELNVNGLKIRYVPDFIVDGLGLIEIKPTNFILTHNWVNMIEAITAKTGGDFTIQYGIPFEKSSETFFNGFISYDDGENEIEDFVSFYSVLHADHYEVDENNKLISVKKEDVRWWSLIDPCEMESSRKLFKHKIDEVRKYQFI